MNHYPRHIGDWRVATWNLTKLQRCIYSDLIDTYYDKERPIPAKNIAEELGCRADDEVAALAYVLSRYFKLDGDVYRHQRCDEEIAHVHHVIEVAKKAGRASASKRGASAARAERKQNAGSTPVERPLNATSTSVQPPSTQYPVPTSLEQGVQGGGATSPPADPEVEPKFKPSKKCPKAFAVLPGMAQWAMEKCPLLTPHDIQTETDKFRDHTFGNPITDWSGAWRNWLRKEQQFREQRAGVVRGPAVNARDAERQRVLESMNQGEKNAGSRNGAIDVEARVVGDPEAEERAPE